MATRDIKQAESVVLNAVGEKEVDPKPQAPIPGYKVIGSTKIGVSKAFGKSVERRKSAALKATEMTRDAWNEAYRYYNHNQTKDDTTRSGPRNDKFRKGDSSENLVYANVSTLVPAIYSKNPTISFTTEQDEDKEFVKVLGKAVQAVLDKKSPLGINLKPRAKKAVLHAELANFGVLKLEWVRKDESREAANAEMESLMKELEEAKDSKVVAELEGKMMALESEMEWREPSGFKLNTCIPTNIIIDPFAENEDGSDANWTLEEVYLPTEFLNAKYTDRKKDNDERHLIYKPTHKVKLDGVGNREDALGLVLEAIDEGVEDRKDHTDDERQSYIYQNMTRCWYYWDKTTRRIYLFVDNDWTWPVWVWQDDVHTSRFFPYYYIIFSPSTGGVTSPSEVSYYLDQQDELNKINAEIVKFRRMVFNILLYNNNKLKPDDARKLANFMKTGRGSNSFGVDVPDGQTIKDCLETLAPPSVNFKEAFDKQQIYASIDRVGSASDILRGQQFKTNTTNQAIESYTSAAKLRLDNRTDAIEDCVADIAWTIAEVLVSQADKEYIEGLIGETNIKDWKEMSIRELNATCSVKVAAGSSEKPTSERKKEQAIKVAQAVGQFAAGAPVSSMRIVLKMMMLAFPELDITEEDWAAILQEMQMQMQRGVSTGQDAGSGQAPANGQDQARSAIESRLQNLPPEEKAKVMQQIQQGVDPRQALAPYIQEASNAQTQ